MSYQRCLDIKLPPGVSGFLWGIRKAGKTTYLRDRFPRSLRFDLLRHDLFLDLSRRPWHLREQLLGEDAGRLAQPIVIDEIQKIPELMDEIHLLIEEYKLSFLLCGSSARKLTRKRANLLGGRAWRYEMYPCIYKEIPNFDLLRACRYGLLPAHYLSRDPRRELSAYVVDYLNEEIIAEGHSRNLPVFSRFLDAVGYSCGELVNYANIARDCQVSATTVREYFTVLADTLLGFFLFPYKKTGRRQVISSAPKFYLSDVGIANRLAKRSFEEMKGEAAGKAFEQFLAMELVAYRSYTGTEVDLAFWRTKSGLEVDFVLSTPDGIHTVEVSLVRSVDRKDIKGLVALAEEHSVKGSYVVCQEPRPRRIEAGPTTILALPWQDFLERLWIGKIL